MPQPNIADAKCILVLGATAGIGRELAIAIHDLPSKPTVIVAGRRQNRLDELSHAHKRMHSVCFDISGDRKVLEQFVKSILKEYPDVRLRPTNDYECLLSTSQLDAVMFSAGVQHVFDFHKPEEIDLDCKYRAAF